MRPCSAVTLDIAWLPSGLTSLSLTGISLSCDGCKSYIESKGVGYVALLLQVRVGGNGAGGRGKICMCVCVSPMILSSRGSVEW